MHSDATFMPAFNRWLKDRVGAVAAAVRAYSQARQDRSRLSQMPDPILRDIGLTRDDVRRITRTLHF
jgi:uncharacterized protein YjiS (DUF1127 family)